MPHHTNTLEKKSGNPIEEEKLAIERITQEFGNPYAIQRVMQYLTTIFTTHNKHLLLTSYCEIYTFLKDTEKLKLSILNAYVNDTNDIEKFWIAEYLFPLAMTMGKQTSQELNPSNQPINNGLAIFFFLPYMIDLIKKAIPEIYCAIFFGCNVWIKRLIANNEQLQSHHLRGIIETAAKINGKELMAIINDLEIVKDESLRFQIQTLKRNTSNIFSENNIAQQAAALKIQEVWHSSKDSSQRLGLHKTIFGNFPQTKQIFPKVFLHNIPNDEIRSLILSLAEHQSIINNKVTHWTILNNLKSILKTGYIFSNQKLKEKGIDFKKNALVKADIKNGDDTVVCCCPALVDADALVNREKIKPRKGLVRLTLNLDYIDLQGKFNQFFKLYDLCAPGYQYNVKINEDLIVSFNKKNNGKLICSLTFKGKKVDFPISSSNALFYGNLKEINLYCLVMLFNMLATADDEQFKIDFNLYLEKLTTDELKKVLILFAQGLTLYSEYNFHPFLRITKGLIAEIYLADKNISLNLEALNPEVAQAALTHLATTGQLHYSDNNIPPLVKVCNDKLMSQYQILISYHYRELTLEAHYATISPASFQSKTYFETRPGLPNSLLPNPLFNNLNKDIFNLIEHLNKNDIDKAKNKFENIKHKYKTLGKIYMGFDNGFSVLYKYIPYAYGNFFIELVDFFVQAGIDLNKMGNQGTLLHQAAYYGSIEIAYALLKNGAEISLTTDAFPDIAPAVTAAQLAFSAYNIPIKLGHFADILQRDVVNPTKHDDAKWSLVFRERGLYFMNGQLKLTMNTLTPTTPSQSFRLS